MYGQKKVNLTEGKIYDAIEINIQAWDSDETTKNYIIINDLGRQGTYAKCRFDNVITLSKYRDSILNELGINVVDFK